MTERKVVVSCAGCACPRLTCALTQSAHRVTLQIPTSAAPSQLQPSLARYLFEGEEGAAAGSTQETMVSSRWRKRSYVDSLS